MISPVQSRVKMRPDMRGKEVRMNRTVTEQRMARLMNVMIKKIMTCRIDSML